MSSSKFSGVSGGFSGVVACSVGLHRVGTRGVLLWGIRRVWLWATRRLWLWDTRVSLLWCSRRVCLWGTWWIWLWDVGLWVIPLDARLRGHTGRCHRRCRYSTTPRKHAHTPGSIPISGRYRRGYRYHKDDKKGNQSHIRKGTISAVVTATIHTLPGGIAVYRGTWNYFDRLRVYSLNKTHLK